MGSPYFTVFTPTYNRAYILDRVYKSLLNQTVHNFEWLIVDDGSTDNTRELVEKWRFEAPFPIRYIYQKNMGKHFAANVGVREAKGDLFLFHDSDDACVPETLEEFHRSWESIPEKVRGRYSTLSVLCVDQNGNVVGGKYPSDVIDAENGWDQYKLRSSGERWGINRTDILRLFPFPEIKGEKFIPEGIIWNRMALKFRTRFVNNPLRIYEHQTDSITGSIVKILANSPMGASLYYNELGYLPLPMWVKVRAATGYVRYSFHGKIPMKMIINNAISPLWTVLLLWLGYILYRVDKNKI